jgi:hypothetical protein
MGKQKNINTIEEILIDAPKPIRKIWKKIKRNYKKKKFFKGYKPFLLHLTECLPIYSKHRKKEILNAWNKIYGVNCKAEKEEKKKS